MSNEHGRRLERWVKDGKPGTKPVPAATVILVRDGEEGLETLMLRRNSKIAFGGMWVFPGGRVDAADCEEIEDGDELGAARCAAVREAEEEAGLSIDANTLVAFSHWTPPPVTPKRFLTWFFLAPAPEGDVAIDEGEIHEHEWLRPRDALRRRDAGEIELAPPTFVTLHELAAWPTVDDAVAAAGARTPERFETRICMSDGGPVVLWHGDAGYEAGDASAEGSRHRLRMADDGWRYERTISET